MSNQEKINQTGWFINLSSSAEDEKQILKVKRSKTVGQLVSDVWKWLMILLSALWAKANRQEDKKQTNKENVDTTRPAVEGNADRPQPPCQQKMKYPTMVGWWWIGRGRKAPLSALNPLPVSSRVGRVANGIKTEISAVGNCQYWVKEYDFIVHWNWIKKGHEKSKIREQKCTPAGRCCTYKKGNAHILYMKFIL